MSEVIAEVLEQLRSVSRKERELAWRVLHDRNYDSIYRMVCCLGCPPGEAEDVVQRVFQIAYRRILEAAEIRSLDAWLRGIAVRVVKQRRRWNRVRGLKRWLVQSTAEASAKRPESPEARTSAQETREMVEAILDSMSPKLRDVLVLVELEQCSPREAAESLQIPVNTVRSRRRMAREQFLRLWTRRHGKEL